MKKELILLLLLMASIVVLGQIEFVEPMLLPNGVGKVSLGIDPYLRYGILDIMEVGLDPLPYIKLGTNIGDFWASIGYGYFPAFASYDQTSTVFVGIGYYPRRFSASVCAMYSEKEDYDYTSPDPTMTIVTGLSVVSEIKLNNLEKKGNIKFIAGYNYNMNTSENNYFVALNAGSFFDWNWWIFRELYIYGGIGTDLPFEDLSSIGIMADIESVFQFFK
ncbi:hypothetical protein [Kosmotoga olearia]|uniref:Uncharacterized protein n=1 Tax=Kosmotoga olearia (strain ATCC BAA-1733 / DSM 21960 / TBF 19.5.1) TaxID=521045 RepID=C5CGA3_KOSOT|nr:hypothetical protein [Kosmotoga olearia]ACR79544.1 hypothetical protein Kole_0834 [Kosmotoga olearia TBF 19.5.1]